MTQHAHIHVHVYILLQPKNSETLCHALIEVAEKSAPDLLPEATTTARKFKHAFHLFALCHLVYDSAYLLEDTKIDQLRR